MVAGRNVVCGATVPSNGERQTAGQTLDRRQQGLRSAGRWSPLPGSDCVRTAGRIGGVRAAFTDVRPAVLRSSLRRRRLDADFPRDGRVRRRLPDGDGGPPQTRPDRLHHAQRTRGEGLGRSALRTARRGRGNRGRRTVE